MKIRASARPALSLVALALAAGLASAQLAQEPAPDGPRGTPRASLLGYLEACRASDYEEAARYLELRQLAPEEREREGPRLARQLKVVLDQTLWVDVEALSAEPGGALDDDLSPRHDLIGKIPASAGPVEVLISRARAGSGQQEWRIAATTVARVPDLYREFGFGPLGEVLPSFMFKRFGEFELWQLIGLLSLVVVAYVLGAIASRLITRAARRLVERTETTLDDRILTAAAGPLTTTLWILIFYASSAGLALAVPVQQAITWSAMAGVVVSVTWLALRLIDVAAELLEGSLQARGETTAITVIPVGRRVVKVFLVLIAVLSGLQNLGFNVLSLVAGLGVGGLAVALAAQKTFEDFFGALSILVDRPVKRGDFCRFGDKIGIIEDIGLRSTRIRTLDRTVITVPNAEFASLQIENFAARDRIRFFTVLGLRYETSADQMRHVLVELKRLLVQHEMVDPDPARIRFVSFGAFSLDVEVYAYVRTSDWNEFLKVREDLLLRIIDVVEASGTGFAFPSQTLYLGKDDGLDAERTRSAEEQVRAWKQQRELYLPDFPEEQLRELQGSLPFPDETSASRPDR